MNYESAKEHFASWDIDTEQALQRLSDISISVHCWQGDDVVGFENQTGLSGGGIQATGNHPGRARNPEELRNDLEFSFSKIPGNHRLNLHAMYMDTNETPDRDEIEYKHFETWVDWAKQININLDFNPTFFAHNKADDNLTLAHPNASIRDFWIEHGKRTREIASKIGAKMGSACINNIWVPDGYKDIPIDRMAARSRLEKSLDAILEKPRQHLKDAVESKLFGIGVEACTVGSHEFYMGYAIRNKTLLCIDMGHFHPTESTADKLSALALSLDEILLHVSRPMRWDSDHVILMNDEVLSMAHELVSADLLNKTNIGLDFFDATISRTAAWVIGTRNMQKALLQSLLKPWKLLRDAENKLDFTKRLTITEELKDLPHGVVWEEFCTRHNMPVGQSLIKDLEGYQNSVSGR
jgi:L-rhamnose isomerase